MNNHYAKSEYKEKKSELTVGVDLLLDLFG